MADKNIEAVLWEIVDSCGMDMLANGKGLVAAFCDLSNVKKDQRMLRYFVEAGGHTALLGARNLSPAMQQTRLQQTIQKLCTEMLVSDEAAQTVCYAFWTVAYGKPAIQQKSQLRSVAEKTVSAPAQYRSAPVKVPVEVDPDLEINGNVVVGYRGNKSYVRIPDGIVSIGECAFFENETLTGVEFPESLENIGKRAFCRTSLQTIVLPGRLKYVADDAFSLCGRLEKVEFACMPQKLSFSAFKICEKLHEVILPDGTESVYLYAFETGNAMIHIHIPDSVKYVSSSSGQQYKIVASSKWIADHQSLFLSHPNLIPVPSGKQQDPEAGGERNSAKALYELAIAYDEKAQFGHDPNAGPLALQYLMQSAQLGYADALYKLGTFCVYGLTRCHQTLVEKEANKALSYYRAAAEGGNPYAQLAIATHCGKQGNHEEEVSWSRKAAEQDAPNGEPALAHHLKCLGTEESLAEALRIFLKYAQLDSSRYHDDVAEFYEKGWGTPRDLLQAARWKKCFWWDGTVAGDAKALFDVGRDYSTFANGNQEKLYLAFEYFMEAAKRNSADGQFRVGDAYEYGYGVAVNPQEAAKWHHKAAEQNHKSACHHLSVMYSKGIGVPWNPIEARKWKKKAGY